MEVVERFLTGSRVQWEERGPASGLGWFVNIIQKCLSASRYTHDSLIYWGSIYCAKIQLNKNLSCFWINYYLSWKWGRYDAYKSIEGSIDTLLQATEKG